MVKKQKKESSQPDINSSLDEADRIAEEQQIVYPTENEKKSISSYCTLTLKCKEIEAKAKQDVKDIKPVIKNLREKLLSLIKESKEEILQIPLHIRNSADSKLSSSMPKTPAYIRLTKNTKDITISSDILNDAFDNLTEDDVNECKLDGCDAIIECIINSVRRLIRSFNEQAKLTDTIPRGMRPADIKFASEDLSIYAIELHELSTKISLTEKSKRDLVNASKQDIEKKLPDVETFFSRANTTSQRVNLENQSYNLCCRQSVSKPKVTLKILEHILEDSVKPTFLDKKIIHKKDILSVLHTKKTELLKLVQLKLGNLKTTTKKKIHLQRIGVKPSE